MARISFLINMLAALKGSQFYFYLLTAGVVSCHSCGGPKKTHSSSIVQIIFSFWSSEISDGILRNQKFIIGLDSFSNQTMYIHVIGSVWIILVFVSTILLKVGSIFCQIYQGH